MTYQMGELTPLSDDEQGPHLCIILAAIRRSSRSSGAAVRLISVTCTERLRPGLSKKLRQGRWACNFPDPPADPGSARVTIALHVKNQASCS